jgi:hypothetical protein
MTLDSQSALVTDIFAAFKVYAEDVSGLADSLLSTISDLGDTRNAINRLRGQVNTDEWISDTISSAENWRDEINSGVQTLSGIPVIGAFLSGMEEETVNMVTNHITNYAESQRIHTSNIAVFSQSMRNRTLELWRIMNESHNIGDLLAHLQYEAQVVRARSLTNMVLIDQLKVDWDTDNGIIFKHAPVCVIYIQKDYYKHDEHEIPIIGDICINMRFPMEKGTVTAGASVKTGYLTQNVAYLAIVFRNNGLDKLIGIDQYVSIRRVIIDFETGEEILSDEYYTSGEFAFDTTAADNCGSFPVYCTLPIVRSYLSLMNVWQCRGENNIMHCYKAFVEQFCTAHPPTPFSGMNLSSDEVRGHFVKHYRPIKLGGFRFDPFHYNSVEDTVDMLAGNDSDGTPYVGGLSTYMSEYSSVIDDHYILLNSYDPNGDSLDIDAKYVANRISSIHDIDTNINTRTTQVYF